MQSLTGILTSCQPEDTELFLEPLNHSESGHSQFSQRFKGKKAYQKKGPG